MIATLSGILVAKSGQNAIVEAAGVGYRLMMPAPDLGSLPPVGEQVRVFTYLQIKDDAMNLYGFESAAKKDLFSQLIGVSNVGPKAAMNILSHLTPDQLAQAIMTEDFALISGAPGVGRKTAQRLVLELKEKLGFNEVLTVAGGPASALAQAREALVNLGYDTREAAAALGGVDEGRTVDWYIKFALKRLAKA